MTGVVDKKVLGKRLASVDRNSLRDTSSAQVGGAVDVQDSP